MMNQGYMQNNMSLIMHKNYLNLTVLKSDSLKNISRRESTMTSKIFYLLLFSLLIFSCGQKDETKPISNQTKQEKAMELKITSSAFEESGMIPKNFTCDGDNVSPELSWSGSPAETKSFALICDDPDAPAGIWVHWVVYNIPGNAKGIPEAVSTDKQLYNGTIQGLNSSRKTGYSGPCPPGGTHRYFFKVYALDTTLTIQGDVTKDILLESMKGHILAQGELMGKYTRNR
jgi:Raf kinase inhibitor-like YbhB/YbcL family protein